MLDTKYMQLFSIAVKLGLLS